jgi:hypothetical protein
VSDPSSDVVWGERRVSVSAEIDAPASALFDVIADPSLHPVIDGSGTVRGSRDRGRRLALGDRFTTSMRLGVPYLISNTVVEFDEPRLLAWSHVGGWRWRFELDDLGDGRTRVTETFDWSTARTPLGHLYLERLGWPRRNAESMRRTLERLGAFVGNRTQAV